MLLIEMMLFLTLNVMRLGDISHAIPADTNDSGIRIDLGDGITLELVWIPPGEFQMGSPDDEQGRQYDEGPVRTIAIPRGFWMGKYPVTQGQWERVMGSNPSHFRGNRNLPVEKVTLETCRQFLETLNHHHVPNDRMGTFRLPSEAEWEYACRAGGQWRFSFGDDYEMLGKFAWYRGNSFNQTHPVGQKKPNAFGLYDMHGNVWELCADSYRPQYPVDDAQNSEADSGYYERYPVARGGSWFTNASNCRTAFRYVATAALGQYEERGSSSTIGFRVLFAESSERP